MRHTFRHKLGYAKWCVQELIKELSYRFVVPWNRRFKQDFWDNQADTIHTRWGNQEHDYQILNNLFERYKPISLLDVGCGSGRLFKLYEERNIHDIVGIDISMKALAIARERHPSILTICGNLEDLDFPQNRFDIAICNRVLQHIPSHQIGVIVGRLCRWSRLVYVNEFTETDQLKENFYMQHHDYSALFSGNKFELLDSGRLGDQSYRVYGRLGSNRQDLSTIN